MSWPFLRAILPSCFSQYLSTSSSFSSASSHGFVGPLGVTVAAGMAAEADGGSDGTTLPESVDEVEATGGVGAGALATGVLKGE